MSKKSSFLGITKDMMYSYFKNIFLMFISFFQTFSYPGFYSFWSVSKYTDLRQAIILNNSVWLEGRGVLLKIFPFNDDWAYFKKIVWAKHRRCAVVHSEGLPSKPKGGIKIRFSLNISWYIYRESNPNSQSPDMR